MKKTLSIVVVTLLAAIFSVNAYSQVFKFGVKAGMDFTNMSGLEEMKERGFLKTYTGFHVGGLMSINLPLGFLTGGLTDIFYKLLGIPEDLLTVVTSDIFNRLPQFTF